MGLTLTIIASDGPAFPLADALRCQVLQPKRALSVRQTWGSGNESHFLALIKYGLAGSLWCNQFSTWRILQ